MQRNLSSSFLVLIGIMLLAGMVALAVIGSTQGVSGATLRATSQAEATEVTLALNATLTPPTSTPTLEATETPDRPPTETPRPTQEPRATRTPRPTTTPTITPLPSPTRTPRPTPRPDPEGQAHYWFERPISAEHDNSVAVFYPYASTGEGQYPVHYGVEFVNQLGVPVLAAGPGEVIFAGEDGTQGRLGPPDRDYAANGSYYGYAVVIRHDERYNDQAVYTLYGHMNEVTVQRGDRVDTGQQIGTVGTTGVALGPHLHFEVRVGRNHFDATRNPQLWLRPFPGNGTLIGRVIKATGDAVPEAFITLQRPDSETVARYVYSYAEATVNSDDEWGENFLIGDLPSGPWQVAVEVDDVLVVEQVYVAAGQTNWLWLELPNNRAE